MVRPLLALSISLATVLTVNAQVSFTTKAQALAVSSFFDRYESIYLECKALQKVPLNDSLNLEEWASKIRYACDPNRRVGLSIPKDIPADAYEAILRGTACFDVLAQTMYQLAQLKLTVESDRTMSEQDRKTSLRLRGELENLKMSACVPHIQRIEELRREASRAAR